MKRRRAIESYKARGLVRESIAALFALVSAMATIVGIAMLAPLVSQGWPLKSPTVGAVQAMVVPYVLGIGVLSFVLSLAIYLTGKR